MPAGLFGEHWAQQTHGTDAYRTVTYVGHLIVGKPDKSGFWDVKFDGDTTVYKFCEPDIVKYMNILDH